MYIVISKPLGHLIDVFNMYHKRFVEAEATDFSSRYVFV